MDSLSRKEVPLILGHVYLLFDDGVLKLSKVGRHVDRVFELKKTTCICIFVRTKVDTIVPKICKLMSVCVKYSISS